MRSMHRTRSKRAQSSLELAILFAVVIIAFVALQFYVRNAASGRLKSSADSVSQTQFDPLKGKTNITINRVTTDKTYGVGELVFGGTSANGNAGRQLSNTTSDVSNRFDQ